MTKPATTNKAEIVQLLEQLTTVEDQLALLRVDLEKARDAALTPQVRAELAAIDEEIGPRIQHGESLVAGFKEKIKAAVIARGETVRGGRMMAVFNKARISWDSKALLGFARAYPEVETFKTELEPTVSFRWAKDGS